jgi:hypothetical protein
MLVMLVATVVERMAYGSQAGARPAGGDARTHTHTIRLACAVPGEVPPSYGEVERVRRRAALRTAAPPRPTYVTSPASIISAGSRDRPTSCCSSA